MLSYYGRNRRLLLILLISSDYAVEYVLHTYKHTYKFLLLVLLLDDWTIRVPVRKSEKEKTERKKSGTNKDTSVSPDPIKKTRSTDNQANDNSTQKEQ